MNDFPLFVLSLRRCLHNIAAILFTFSRLYWLATWLSKAKAENNFIIYSKNTLGLQPIEGQGLQTERKSDFSLRRSASIFWFNPSRLLHHKTTNTGGTER